MGVLEINQPVASPSAGLITARPVLQFDHVTVSFDERPALIDVSIELSMGQTIVLFGAAGSGKTVLLKTAIGLVRAGAGRVYLFGQDITNLAEEDLFPLRRRVGVLFQESALFDSLTVAENVAFALRDQRGPKPPESEVEARVSEALDVVELGPESDKYPSELSGGMRRRVGIARAAVTKPPLMLYDSPTAGLDPISAYRIIALLIRERDSRNATTVVVTQRRQDGYLLANCGYDPQSGTLIRSRDVTRLTTFLVLREARMIFQGSEAELRSSHDPYVAKFARNNAPSPDQRNQQEHEGNDVLSVLYPTRPNLCRIAFMCGIAGMVNSRLGPDKTADTLARMSEALKHRGPDDAAIRMFPEVQAGLAFRRLALVDLVSGNQPISNEDQSLHIVANGEIYNHRELRCGLERKGHRFRTATDIEAVLHLYEDFGTVCLQRLQGMFGLAILDSRARRVILARDRCGMKPLYYASTASGFLFASEPGALFASTLVDKAPDWTALDTYLTVGYTPAPRTCFAGVRKLTAGSYLVVEGDGMKEAPYWRLNYKRQAPRAESECAEELEGRLRAAVRSHLAADVPVGAFVSGGWDSSLVGLMAARLSPQRLKTFSIVFPEFPEVDEAPYSRLLAAEAGTEHHEIAFRAPDIPRVLPRAVRHLGEPCLASPCILLYQLSCLAASHVKAVVGGEGSDELFAGYEWLQWRSDLYYWLRRAIPGGCVRRSAGHIQNLQWGRLFRVLAASDDLAADAEWYRIFSPSEQHALFSFDSGIERAGTGPLRLDSETQRSCRDRLQRRLALEFTRRLPEGILLVADRMSMAHSLEVRMPFLDTGLLEFAASLPSHRKRRGRQEKYALSLLKGLLPDAIARRKKFGLVAPMRQYLRGPLRGWVREVLLDSDRLGGLLDRAKLEAALASWMDGKDPYLRRPWSLIVLQTWWNEYFGSSTVRQA